MIAVDTNILVYAHRSDSPWHDRASECVRSLAEGTSPWLIPWPCIHEFLAVVTHPRIYGPPTPLETALRQVDAWLASPCVVVSGESAGYWQAFRALAGKSRVAGSLVHDAHVATICIEQAIEEMWTADRDFGRFGDVKVRNPLIS